MSYLAYSIIQSQLIAKLIRALPQVAFYVIIIVRALESKCIVYTHMNVYIHIWMTVTIVFHIINYYRTDILQLLIDS